MQGLALFFLCVILLRAINVYNMRYISLSVGETKKFAAELVKKNYPSKKGALVFGLVGELGAGKTHFAQGAAVALGIKRNITSPTFVLMKKYGISSGELKMMYHIDSVRDILDLGWSKIILDRRNVVFVEWAEKIKSILPRDTILIFIKDLGGEKREITID